MTRKGTGWLFDKSFTILHSLRSHCSSSSLFSELMREEVPPNERKDRKDMYLRSVSSLGSILIDKKKSGIALSFPPSLFIRWHSLYH